MVKLDIKKENQISSCCGAKRQLATPDGTGSTYWACSNCLELFEPVEITPCIHGRPDYRSCPHCLGINQPGKKDCCGECYASRDTMGYLPVCLNPTCSCHKEKECKNADCFPCHLKFNTPPQKEEWEERSLKKIAKIFKDWILAVQKNKLFDEYYPLAHERIKEVIRSEKELSERKGEAKKGESNRKAYMRGYEEGMCEATPQYKKDMQDCYNKGCKEVIEKVREMIETYKVKVAKAEIFSGNPELSHETANYLLSSLNSLE